MLVVLASDGQLPHWASMIFVLTVMLTCWCCFFRGNYETDNTDAIFEDIVRTPKPREGTVYYKGNLVKAALFPTFDGRWNVTIQESQLARDKSIIGLHLEDLDHKNVYLREKDDFILGFTKKEWFVHGPHMIIMIVPFVFGLVSTCPDIRAAEVWIPVFCFLNWFSNVWAFCNRIHQAYEPTRAKKFFGLMKITQIGLAFWGVTLFWPKTADGWGEKLDCNGPNFFIGWMLSTLYVGLFTTVAIIGILYKATHRHDFEYEEDLVDNRPVKEIKRRPCSRCPCCRKSGKEDLEMSVSQPAGEEL